MLIWYVLGGVLCFLVKVDKSIDLVRLLFKNCGLK